MPTITKATMNQVIEAIKTVRPFLSASQLEIMGSACRGEEREWFKAKFIELADLIAKMPETYAQDGKGDAAIVTLCYFTKSTGHHWYITEKDKGDGSDDLSQHQAYGLSDLDEGEEKGYISLPELFSVGAQLDLHFTPTTVGEVKKIMQARAAA